LKRIHREATKGEKEEWAAVRAEKLIWPVKIA
jgi:hypothetical protein